MRKVWVRRTALAAVGVAALMGTALALDRLFPPPLDRLADLSVTVTDRKGQPLRVFTNAAGAWRLPATVDDVSPLFVELLLAYEDRRFESHAGVDPLAVLGAALSYSFAGIFGRRFKSMGVSPLVTATGQVTASTLMLLPVALLADRPWTLPMPSAAAWGAVIGIALLSTALAYVIFFRVLASAGATNLMLVTFLIPVSAILLGGLFLGERLAVRHGIGIALIAGGLAAIDGRLFARLGQRRSASIAKG